MGIWKASLGGLELGWKAPAQGPVHPMFVNLAEANGLGWLYGFDELLVRCGLESNGAPEFNPNGTLRYPLHGRIANLPAHRVEVSIDGVSGEITVTGTVDETRLFGSKLRMVSTVSTKVGESSMSVSDVITNISAEPGELELLYHVNYGAPLLGPGAKAVLPVRRIAPRDEIAVGNADQWDVYGPETPGSSEAVFFLQLAADAGGNTQTLLHNAAGDQGVTMKFNIAQLPCFSLWKSRQAAVDGYVTGFEPGANFPNRRSFEKQQGRVLAIQPGESRRFDLVIEALPDTDAVGSAAQAVAGLQQGVTPEILQRPDPQWSA